MGYILTDADRARIQIALAEAFVDSTVDYASIAERIRGFDPKVVEDILYSEVAPVCFSNLETPVPPVWSGFQDEWLLKEIAEELKARKASWLGRSFHLLKVTWLRYSYGYIWKELAKSLKPQ
ncbi:DUF7079 family protein [Pseudomonas hamedanensis]|uniref:DUF7079 domain-containing protein n=1 Tax=Pseudomonas hamedanensis TaxID=2745504 RepID=A0A9E6P4U7_9PSED|nr:hypothetical protein [Pseudomonas hamedanensis]QXI19438.1 hypothetical protein HU739_010710 [Pseudomonas hamedanensis]